MTLQEALVVGIRQLTAAGIESAPRDARRLIAHVLGMNADRVTLHAQDAITNEVADAFDKLIVLRAGHTPLSHLVGGRNFYNRWFKVTPDVLDPRPETETLIETALAVPFDRVLDLGTGSGCILLTLLSERSHVIGVGTDLSPDALNIARENAVILGVADRTTFLEGDWFAALRSTPQPEQFPLIVSNPPYIADHEMSALAPEVRDHEPRMALTDAADGYRHYRQIIRNCHPHLVLGGRLIVEIGPTQADVVGELMTQAGMSDIRVVQDLDGRDRVICAKKRTIHVPIA